MRVLDAIRRLFRHRPAEMHVPDDVAGIIAASHSPDGVTVTYTAPSTGEQRKQFWKDGKMVEANP